jgi:GTPase SAR1 family protein
VAQIKSQQTIGSSVYGIVSDLRADTASLAFPIPIPGATEASAAQTLLMAQLDDHLLPRLAELSTPAMVVVAGSTGTGKSTITNSLVGEELSPAGIKRPTTVEPILVVHPSDRELIDKTPIGREVSVVTSARVPRGVALLDAPDLDSIRDENRAGARKLLESADLWLFVTSAQRYGDALPWKTLTSAVERGTNVAMIMNRVPAASEQAVVADLHKRLVSYGLGKVPLFVIADQGPHEGLLAPETVKEVRNWLENVAGQDQAQKVIVSTLKGSLAALPPRLISLADATDQQVTAKKNIVIAARRLLVRTVQDIRTAVADHQLLDGAAEATWSLFASKARLDKVLDRSGYAKGSARRVRAREEAAAEVLPDLRSVLVAAGLDTVEESRANLREGLTELDGGSLLEVSSFPHRGDEVAAVIQLWTDSVLVLLEKFTEQTTTKQVQAATKNVGMSALHVILTAAVLGQADASELVRMLLGNESQTVVDEARAELADHYDRLILGEYVYVTEQLDELGLEDGSSARIRVRVAELKKIR